MYAMSKDHVCPSFFVMRDTTLSHRFHKSADHFPRIYISYTRKFRICSWFKSGELFTSLYSASNRARLHCSSLVFAFPLLLLLLLLLIQVRYLLSLRGGPYILYPRVHRQFYFPLLSLFGKYFNTHICKIVQFSANIILT